MISITVHLPDSAKDRKQDLPDSPRGKPYTWPEIVELGLIWAKHADDVDLPDED